MTLDSDLIQTTIEALNKEIEAIENQMYDLLLYMNSGITLSEIKNMSYNERDTLMRKLNEKISAMSGKEWM